MPRDLNLFSPHRNFRDPGAGADPEPALTASPENQNPTPRPGEEQDEGASSYRFNIYRDASEDREMQLSNNLRRGDAKDKLHPYVQTLQIEDLDSCLALENAAFPEHERCTREKVCSECPSAI